MSLFDILKLDNFYGEDEVIEIAKGKYQYIDNVDKIINKVKREYRWLKR